MNTIRTLVMQWFNELDTYNKSELSHKYYKETISYNFTSLTGREIENIFYNEVIIKWFSSKTYHEQHELSDLYFDSRNPSLFIAEQVKEIYLKEHSKEEPALDFKYCKNEIEGGNKCYVQCDHCKEYYAPLEMEQPLSVNKDVEVDGEKTFEDFEEWIVVRLAETGFKGFTFDETKEIVDKAMESREKRKVEVNSWDDVFRLIKLETRSDSLTEKIVETLKNNYTLTKKQ